MQHKLDHCTHIITKVPYRGRKTIYMAYSVGKFIKTRSMNVGLENEHTQECVQS